MDNKQIKEALRHEEARELLHDLTEQYEIEKVAELVKDNKIDFEYKGIKYRTRLLNAKEKDTLDMLRRKKFGQLIQDKDILLEKDLIVIYKERGIDIESIDEEIKKINIQIADKNYKLGEALAKKSGEIILNTHKEDMEKLVNELYQLSIKRTHLLEYSLENQLQNYVAEVITYLSLEKSLEDDKWVKAFNSLEEFLQQDEEFINTTSQYSMTLHYRPR